MNSQKKLVNSFIIQVHRKKQFLEVPKNKNLKSAFKYTFLSGLKLSKTGI
jgi:hypothetical protein